MRRSFAICVLLAACGSTPRPSAPIESAGGEPAPAADPPCCCTFDFATAEDFPDVATWILPQSACRTGTPSRMHGQCIDDRFCVGVQPDPPPLAPLEAGECCCDIDDGNGETTSVTASDTCSNCVDPGFCDRPAS